MVIILSKLEIEDKFLNIVKGTYEKPKTSYSVVKNGCFPPEIGNKANVSPFTAST